ncbi:MAG: hypothetical protein AAGD01_05325 [Acidobacteriota bacterium]
MVEVTCRTFQGRLLLTPTASLRRITVGVLYKAQIHYPSIKIYNVVFLSNHYHLLLWAPDARTLADFMAFTNGNLARKLGALVHWEGSLWARRYDLVLVANDDLSQMRRFAYLLSHGVKEGLVRDPRHWPGLHAARALTSNGELEGLWFDGTRACRDRAQRRKKSDDEYTETVTLQLEKLPCWKHLDWKQIAEQVENLLTEIIADGRASFPTVMGAKRIRRQSPQSRVPMPRRGPRPLIHASSKAVRRQMLAAYQQYVISFRKAVQELLGGNLAHPFPLGSCRPPGPWCALPAPGT